MRRERGSGSISKLKGNRRCPYMIRVATGVKMDANGKPHTTYDVLAYAPTLKEARALLKNYWYKGRFYSDVKFDEVYEMFKKWKFPTISPSYQKSMNSAYESCASLHSLVFTEIKPEDLQNVIDNCGKNYPTLRKLKQMLYQMYEYAIMNELCIKNYAKGINIRKYANQYIAMSVRNKLNYDNIDLLWRQRDDCYTQMILFMIYTGVRVSEMLDLTKDNVCLEERYFDIVSSKTKNGIRRVPIADIIYPFVEEWFYKNSQCEYLFHTSDGKHFQYRNYYDSYFTPIMSGLGIYCTPHYCRHTFISLMAEQNVDPIVIRKIIGHSYNAAITEKVYTHFETGALLEQINKLNEWRLCG